MIEDISVRYNFSKINGYTQWTQNNGRDISSLVLTLIPYIGDNNYDVIVKLTDIIYKSDTNTNIMTDILELDRDTAFKKHFPYSNFSIGLLNKKDTLLLDVNETNQHTIYSCIENNFISMLETIKITNGKLFINWINTIPISDYKTSEIYKYSSIDILKITNLISVPIKENDDNYINRLSNCNSVKKYISFYFISKFKPSYFL